MIKGAIFDMDGTLLDSMWIWDTMGEDCLRRMGFEPHEDINETFKSLSLAEAAEYYRREYGVTQSVSEIVEGIDAIALESYRDRVTPKPGAAEFLHRLSEAGVKMCIATSTDRHLVETALRRCGIDGYFSRIFTCTEVGHGKSEPTVFRAALEYLGTTRSDTYIFEDACFAIRTAKRDGFKIAAVYDGHQREHGEIRALADWYMDDLTDFDGFFAHASRRRCVIAGGAEIGDYSKIRERLAEDDYFIFCDSGLNHADPLGVSPDLIVGDFDSHENPHSDVETIVLPRRKDDTDTFFAVKEGIRRGFDDFLLIGAIGARLDHSLGNVSILLYLDSLSKHGIILDDYSEMELVSRAPAYISDSFSYFSLLNITGTARGITVKNALFPLENGEITCKYQYGVSNEVLPGCLAEVTVKDGALLLVRVY